MEQCGPRLAAARWPALVGILPGIPLESSCRPETVGIGEYYQTSLRSYGLEWQLGSCFPKGQVALGQEVISVCDPQQPLSVDAALVTLDRALDALNAADMASAPAVV